MDLLPPHCPLVEVPTHHFLLLECTPVGYTPLLLAAIAKSADCIRLLLDKDANLELASNDGNTVCHALLCPAGDRSMLETMLTPGSVKPVYKLTFIKLFSDRKLPWDEANKFGFTPLDLARVLQDQAVVSHLQVRAVGAPSRPRAGGYACANTLHHHWCRAAAPRQRVASMPRCTVRPLCWGPMHACMNMYALSCCPRHACPAHAAACCSEAALSLPKGPAGPLQPRLSLLHAQHTCMQSRMPEQPPPPRPIHNEKRLRRRRATRCQTMARQQPTP